MKLYKLEYYFCIDGIEIHINMFNQLRLEIKKYQLNVPIIIILFGLLILQYALFLPFLCIKYDLEKKEIIIMLSGFWCKKLNIH